MAIVAEAIVAEAIVTEAILADYPLCSTGKKAD